MLVSAFAFGGIPQTALKRVFHTSEIFVSHDLLAEYRAVPQELLAAGKVTADQFRALLVGTAAVVAHAQLVVPRRRLTLCRDAADNMLLECCLAADAALLLTGDRDLLDIDAEPLRVAGLSQLRILSPRAYLRFGG